MIMDMLSPEEEAWCRQAGPYFAGALGLDGGFAVDVARLYLACWRAGLQPRFTSGFRDPGRQRAMRQAWDSGARAGLRARPADPDTSKHCKTKGGRPAALAVDMPTLDDARAGRIATSLGIGSGMKYAEIDPGHFYSLRSVV